MNWFNLIVALWCALWIEVYRRRKDRAMQVFMVFGLLANFYYGIGGT